MNVTGELTSLSDRMGWLKENYIEFEKEKPDRYFDILRYSFKTLGSNFNKPWIVETYLNNKLHARYPDLSFENSKFLFDNYIDFWKNKLPNEIHFDKYLSLLREKE
jgi:hypothetical protein